MGWGVRAALATGAGGDTRTLPKLRYLLRNVVAFDQVADVMAQMIDDPQAYQIVVIDCGSFGGLEVCRHVCRMFREEEIDVPLILITAQIDEQIFPTNGQEPTVLRAPVSSVALRVALDMALKTRFASL